MASAMNELILRSARRGGIMGRLANAGTLAEERRDALNAAMADAELAIKHGDDVARGMAEARIDKILDDTRAARQQAEGPEATPRVSFDGGVRRPLPVRRPRSMNRVIVQSVTERNALAAAARESV